MLQFLFFQAISVISEQVIEIILEESYPPRLSDFGGRVTFPGNQGEEERYLTSEIAVCYVL